MIWPASTDEQAMQLVQSRADHAAFAQLVRRWEGPVRRLCIRMTGDEHRGEDLAQEAFAKVFANRQQFAVGKKFSTWLWRIALNVCFEEGATGEAARGSGDRRRRRGRGERAG